MTTTTALVLWTNELPPAELNPNASGRHAKGEANAHGRRWSAEQEARKWYRELLANRWQTFVRVEQERGRIPFELPLAHARVSVTAEFCWRRRQPAISRWLPDNSTSGTFSPLNSAGRVYWGYSSRPSENESAAADSALPSTPGTRRETASTMTIAASSPPVMTKSPREISSSTNNSLTRSSTPS